jgi:hypothetical protein
MGMNDEVVEAPEPQLAFAITNEEGQPVAEAPPPEPTDISPEKIAQLQEDAEETDPQKP